MATFLYHLLLAALAGTIAWTAAPLLVSRRKEKLKPDRLRLLRRAAAAGGFVLAWAITIANSPAIAWRRPLSGAELAAQEYQRYMERLQALPEFQEWAQQQLKQGRTREQVGEDMASLAPKGMIRVDDGAFATWLLIMRQLYTGVDEHTCAGLAHNSLSSEEMDAALASSLSPEAVEGLYEIYLAAARAELHQDPPKTASREEKEQAMLALFALLPPEDQRHYLDNVRSSSVVSSDAEKCWFMRTTFQQIPGVPSPHALRLGRMLIRH